MSARAKADKATEQLNGALALLSASRPKTALKLYSLTQTLLNDLAESITEQYKEEAKEYIAKRDAEVEAWKNTAALFEKNSSWYRGLLVETASLLGEGVRTDDQGFTYDEPFVSKVPKTLRDNLVFLLVRLEFVQTWVLRDSSAVLQSEIDELQRKIDNYDQAKNAVQPDKGPYQVAAQGQAGQTNLAHAAYDSMEEFGGHNLRSTDV